MTTYLLDFKASRGFNRDCRAEVAMQIVTEEPERELWRQISRFGYEANVDRLWHKLHSTEPSQREMATIVGGVLQAEEYFASSRGATMHVAPLLAYYGAIALGHSFGSMIKGSILPVEGHGANCDPQALNPVADVEVTVNSPRSGALPLISSVLGTSGLSSGRRLAVRHAFAAIPDLHSDFLQCYPNSVPGTLPLTSVVTRKGTIDRIDAAHVPSECELGKCIPQYKHSYLPAQFPQGGSHWVLRRKPAGQDLSVVSVGGQRFLQFRDDGAEPLSLVSAYLVGLYALGFLSRYRTHLWTPFVKGDSTGEHLIVRRFLSLSLRQLPNLMLEALLGEPVRFVASGNFERDTRLTETGIRELVDERIKEQS